MRNGSRIVPSRAARKIPFEGPGALDYWEARMLEEIHLVLQDPSRVEAVHRARVASRRFLAAGEVWARDAGGWHALEERVSRIVRRLGRVRNLDVSLELLRKGPSTDRKARAGLSEILKRRRKKQRARLARWLTARRIGRLGEAIRKVRGSVSSRVPGPPSLRPYFDRLARLAELIGSDGDVEAGHEARRELRRLRYAHETLIRAGDVARFSADAERFRSVQQVAGAWHDLCILEEQALRAVRKGKVSVPVEPLVERIRDEARLRLEEFVIALGELEDLRLRLAAERPE